MLRARHYKAISEIKIMATDSELIAFFESLNGEMERRSFRKSFDHMNPVVTQPSNYSDFWDSFDLGGLSTSFPPNFFNNQDGDLL